MQDIPSGQDSDEFSPTIDHRHSDQVIILKNIDHGRHIHRLIGRNGTGRHDVSRHHLTKPADNVK